MPALRRTALVAIVLSVALIGAHGYPTGAGSCNKPSAPMATTPTSLGFSVTPATQTVNSGGVAALTFQRANNGAFKGFLLNVKDSASKIVGSFQQPLPANTQAMSRTTPDCSSGASGTAFSVTHTSDFVSSGNTAAVTFNWVAPTVTADTTYTVHFVGVVTISQWQELNSAVIVVKKASSDPCATVTCNDNNQCTVDTCNAGSCVFTKAGDGTQCDDGNAATINDKCTNGVCAGLDPCSVLNCDDQNPCTVDGCSNGQCTRTNVADDTSCDDKNPLTVDDKCVAGTCVGRNPCDGQNCDDANPCTTDSCANGQCAHAKVADGTTCDDKNPLTTNDKCTNGVCAGTATNPCATVNCDDANPCTTDSCANGQCAHAKVSDGTTCDDKNPLTTNDKCTNGVCAGTGTTDPCQGMNCDDNNVCTADSCLVGVCVNVPVTTATSCDDKNPLTVNDACVAGVCRGVSQCQATCQDNNACTVDMCDSSDTCKHINLPDGAPCDSGKVCSAGACVSPSSANGQCGTSTANLLFYAGSDSLLPALVSPTCLPAIHDCASKKDVYVTVGSQDYYFVRYSDPNVCVNSNAQ